MSEEIRIEEFSRAVAMFLAENLPANTEVKHVRFATEELCAALLSYCEKHNIRNDIFSTED